MLTSQPRMIRPTIPILIHHTTSDVSHDSQGSGSEKSDSCELISFSFIDYSRRNIVVLIDEIRAGFFHLTNHATQWVSVFEIKRDPFCHP